MAIASLILQLFLIGGDPGIDFVNPIQDKLRAEWHEAGDDVRKIDDLKRKYFLIDIAEDTWKEILSKKPPSKTFFAPSKDPGLSFYQTSLGFALYPFDFHMWVDPLAQQIKNFFNHPFDSLHELLKALPFILFPLFISLFLTFIIHLIIWSVPISKDMPKWIGSNSKYVALCAFSIVIVLTIYSQQWRLAIFIFSLLLIPYSRERIDGLIFSIFFGILLTFQPFINICQDAFNGVSAIEAMQKGRTRIEYSIQDFQSMLPVDKVLWADLNQDFNTAKTMLEKLPVSVEKEILKINFDEEASPTKNIIERYEELRAKISDHPLVIFNLSQLMTKNQQLVVADQLREKIPADQLKDFIFQSSKLNRLLLPPAPSSPFKLAFIKIDEQLKGLLAKYGMNPFEMKIFYKHLLQLLLPWILLLLALFWRKKASGLCIHTGEPTLASDISASSLYLAAAQKDETTNHSLRVQVENLIRRYQHMQKTLIQRLCWFYPSISSLYSNSSITLSWLKVSLVYLFLWNALPLNIRVNILKLFGVDFQAMWIHNYFSMGFSILFVLFYIFFVIREFRSASN